MLLIVGTFRLPPEAMAAARPAMERMVLASRQEEGCVSYSYAEDVLRPGLVHVIESWRDETSLASHFASDHLASWRADCQALGAFDRNLLLYQAGPSRPV